VGYIENVNFDILVSALSENTVSTVPPPAENIEIVREWKSNRNANGISITDENFSGRTINSASLNNDYDVSLGADTQIDLEFMGDAAV